MTKILISFFFSSFFILSAHAQEECIDLFIGVCKLEASAELAQCQPCYTSGKVKRPGTNDAVASVAPASRKKRARPEPRAFTMTVDFEQPQATAPQPPVQQPVAQRVPTGKYATQFATPVDSPMAQMPNWDTVALTDLCYINPTFQTNNDALMTVENQTGRFGRLLVNGQSVKVVRMALVPSGMMDARGNMVPTQGWAVQASVSMSRRGNQRISVLAPGEKCYMTAPMTMGGQDLDVTFISQSIRGFAGGFVPTQEGELLYSVPMFEAERDTDSLRPLASRVERFVFTANELR